MKRSAGLPLREVARRTGLSLPTIRRYVHSGKIQAMLGKGPFGRQWEVSEEELGRFFSDPTRTGRPPDHPLADQTPDSTRQWSDQKPDHRDQPSASDQPDQRKVPGPGLNPSGPGPDSRLREQVAYWRGRWEELRDVLTHLSQSMESRRTATLEEDELESSREALRQRSQELAQARNLVDRLRREKARLEEEVQALRERRHSAEPTLSDGVSVPGRQRLEGMSR